MPTQKPSLDLLRQLTDTHVVQALVGAGRMTRAGIAASTGISKPTVTESIRRLEAAGVVVDTGERSAGRGRAGLYYDLAPGTGIALAVGIAPEGVVVEAVDVRGRVLARETARVPRPARPAAVARTVRRVAAAAVAAPGAAPAESTTEAGGTTDVAAPGPVRVAVVSAADPVDRASGRLVHLPDAPFLVGDLAPADALGDLVGGPVLVDNDVNFSAMAERTASPEPLDDFAYLYLGEGLGAAVVAGGVVLRGAGGLAGEVSHVVVPGARGLAVSFTEVFEELALRHEGTTAVDVDHLLAHLDSASAASRRVVDGIAGAVAAVVSAAVALTDPSTVVLGGPWGRHPAMVAAVADRVAASRRPVTVRAAEVAEAALAGARERAVQALREAVVTMATERVRVDV